MPASGVFAPRNPYKPAAGPFIFDQETGQYFPEPTNVFEQEGKDTLSRMPDAFTSLQDAQFYGQALKVQTKRFLATHRVHATCFGNGLVLNEWSGPWEEMSRFTITMKESVSDAIQH